MDLKPQCHEKIAKMIEKGVDIPNPLTLDIGQEVDIGKISASGVKIYPGCRIYGEKTVISSGAQIGREGPVTIENCQIGRDVELKGGYFSKSVFLDGSNMGLGAHVREGSILEEEAGGAHCVGLKQTILFPFVTLGSLINFCDCLMAGGTSRKDHSEVGSSYIHFNFTPDGDKTTPSLIGDVPRGVMLNQPPIFLGGQGGIVGPVRIGFGNVVAAGSVLRQDCPEDNRLITGKAGSGCVKEFLPSLYPNLLRVVENNIIYLANLMALREWYIHVRKPFFDSLEFGALIHEGLLDKLSIARKERLKRLEAMAKRATSSNTPRSEEAERLRSAVGRDIHKLQGIFEGDAAPDLQADTLRNEFLSGLDRAAGGGRGGYIETIQRLPADVSAQGTGWLERLVAHFCSAASAAMPGLELFQKRRI
ncbi:MAG: Bifunctional protein GlmU [Deltaproteobacteria bacterium ADurb.BinA179]|jgi:UDP-N-acetylglucosamine/UDP-N-acetylgalactosamine diphosphorylase|nr:MAG: Bifunctional protein GlmU [Deltaproteobacteria bacterium ADurb.BinA179]